MAHHSSYWVTSINFFALIFSFDLTFSQSPPTQKAGNMTSSSLEAVRLLISLQPPHVSDHYLISFSKFIFDTVAKLTKNQHSPSEDGFHFSSNKLMNFFEEKIMIISKQSTDSSSNLHIPPKLLFSLYTKLLSSVISSHGLSYHCYEDGSLLFSLSLQTSKKWLAIACSCSTSSVENRKQRRS